MNAYGNDNGGTPQDGVAPARYLILLAAGRGKRAREKKPKQFKKIKGISIYIRALLRFVKTTPLDGIVVVVAPEMVERVTAELDEVLAGYDCPKPIVAVGGESRFQSVDAGLSALDDAEGLVAIHDSARPIVPSDVILRGWDAARRHGAAIPVVPIVDSIRKIDRGGSSRAVRRTEYVAVQTPQVFDLATIRRAYDVPEMLDFTDDASVAEAAGIKVTTFEGDLTNIKITHPTDFQIAKALI